MSLATTSSTARSTMASARASALRIFTAPGSETSAMIPEWPGAIESSSSSASSLRWCSWRTLPVAAPAAPRAAALPRMDGGKMTPRAMPPTSPHLSPDRVLWSVAFWMSSFPSASRLTTTTPSIGDGAAVLDRLQVLVGAPRSLGVGEVGNDEGVGAVRHAGDHARHRRWRGLSSLSPLTWFAPCLVSGMPGRAAHLATMAPARSRWITRFGRSAVRPAVPDQPDQVKTA